MGWETDLLGARFRQISFQVKALTDQGGKALVVHEYPYRSGGAIEDMGCTVRTIPVQAVFWGHNYAFEVQRLIQALEQPGAGELIHPVFGSVQVIIKSWKVEHTAEYPNYAEVLFEAVVSSLDEPFFQTIAPKAQVDQAITTAQQSLKKCMEQAAPVCIQAIEEYATTPLAQGNLSQKLTTILYAYDADGQVPRSTTNMVLQPQVFITELLAIQQAVINETSSNTGMGKYLLWSEKFPRLDPYKGLSSFDDHITYPAHPRYWSKAWISGGRPGLYAQTPSIPVLKENQSSIEEVLYKENYGIEAMLVTYVMLSQTYACVHEVCQFLRKENLSQAQTYTPMDIDALVGNLRMRIQDCLTAVRTTFPQKCIYSVSEPLRTLAEQLQVMGKHMHNTQYSVSLYTVHCEESLHYEGTHHCKRYSAYTVYRWTCP